MSNLPRTLSTVVLATAALTAFFPLTGRADLMERSYEYKEGDTTLEGYLVEPKHPKANTPTVVIVHEWMGLDDYAKERARQVAELGYIALAADIYGKGVRTTSMEEAGKLAGKYKKDIPLFRKRIRAAIDAAAKLPNADAKRVAIMGYCFGGSASLEAARGQMPVIGVASFHGGLSTANPKETKDIQAKVLVMHGADDPMISKEDIQTFQDEMRQAHADWEFISYGDAVHKFSNPHAGNNKASGMAYNEKADKRSWATLVDFFHEIFKQ